jgi:pimeloyl-ACP methyl ester carboxylesterase
MPDRSRATHAPGPYGPQGRSAWMDIDWRRHQRWVDVDGAHVNVIDVGGDEPEDPTPVVFVHGLSGSWQNWLENIPHFARRHRVIAMDLPGFGASPMPPWEISIKRYGELVHRLLDAMDVPGAATVVGNSMGGFISAELAIAEPERVERLVLVSAAGLSIEGQPWGHLVPALRVVDNVVGATTAWFVSKSEPLNRRPRVRKLLTGFVIAHPDKLPAPLLMEQVRGSGKPGFVPSVAALTSYPIRDRLGDIACPTLIVWGTKDNLVPVRDAWEFERLIPNARAVVWKDTGHVPQLERPAAFNDLVEAFEAERPAPRVSAG